MLFADFFFFFSLEKLRILFDFEVVALVKREGVMFVTSIYLFKIGTRGIFVDVRVWRTPPQWDNSIRVLNAWRLRGSAKSGRAANSAALFYFKNNIIIFWGEILTKRTWIVGLDLILSFQPNNEVGLLGLFFFFFGKCDTVTKHYLNVTLICLS